MGRLTHLTHVSQQLLVIMTRHNCTPSPIAISHHVPTPHSPQVAFTSPLDQQSSVFRYGGHQRNRPVLPEARPEAEGIAMASAMFGDA